uniref:SCAN box domain-containing protein n=1 Tax=Xenopus tropicalis TaxID=8364 RepID=A0A1B8Y5U7_XENTR
MACSNMEIHESGQYDLVKEAILRRYNISQETYRQRFRQLKYYVAEVFTHLTDMYKKWMKPELKTHQQITETIVMEQFIKILPEDVSSWVQKHRPNMAEKAILLAEDYLLAKKDAGRHTRRFQQSQVQSEMAKQETKPPAKSDPSGTVCFECHKRGHIATFCLRKSRKTSTYESLMTIPCVPVILGRTTPGFKDLMKVEGQLCAMTTRSQAKKEDDAREQDTLGHIIPFHEDIVVLSSPKRQTLPTQQVNVQRKRLVMHPGEDKGDYISTGLWDTDIALEQKQDAGYKKTLILYRFYWPGVYNHVIAHCRSCPECQYTASVPPKATLAKPMRTVTDKGVAEEVLNVFSRVGLPKHITPLRTTPYHPQTDGLVERRPRGLLDVIREVWEGKIGHQKNVVDYVLQMRERLQMLIKVAHDNVEKAEWKDLKINPELTKEEQGNLKELIKSYDHVFESKPGLVSLVSHQIDIGTHAPIRQKPYRIPE